MPVIPKFQADQTPSHVTVRVRTPYVRPSGAEYLIENNTLHFFCKPFLLKLHFPKDVCDEDEKLSATYDMSDANGTWTICVEKAESGAHFPDLDLTPVLLGMRKDDKDPISVAADSMARLCVAAPVAGGAKIQVLDSVDFPQSELDAAVSQAAISDVPDESLLTGVSFGFNNRYRPPFFHSHSREGIVDIDLPDPDTTPNDSRSALRMTQEDHDFDPERYMADWCEGEEDELFLQATSTPMPWITAAIASLHTVGQPSWEWSDEESEEMRNLRMTELIVDGVIVGEGEPDTDIGAWRVGRQALQAWSGLVTILAAYAYDLRLGGGESTVESSWTVMKLSPTLSWLDTTTATHDTDAQDVLLTSGAMYMRRVLTYPYLRRWDVGALCLQDVVTIALCGKRHVLRALLAVRRYFAHDEQRYLLNSLYVDDYCAWVLRLRDEAFPSFATALQSALSRLSKSHPILASWELETLETVAGSEGVPLEASECESDDSSLSSSSSSSSSSLDSEGSEESEESEDDNAGAKVNTDSSAPNTLSPVI
jgi:protein SHQ1